MSELYEKLKNGLSKLEIGNQVFILQAWETTEEDRLLAEEFINTYPKEVENE